MMEYIQLREIEFLVIIWKVVQCTFTQEVLIEYLRK